MIYTSGIVTDLTREETLEELQDNKLKVVCEKVHVSARWIAAPFLMTSTS